MVQQDKMIIVRSVRANGCKKVGPKKQRKGLNRNMRPELEKKENKKERKKKEKNQLFK